MTVRLAQAVGMDEVAAIANKFGVVDHMQTNLASALGSNETTVLRLTSAYAMLVNGGKKITPTLIDRIQDRNGKTVTRRDTRACADCTGLMASEDMLPTIPDNREQISDPESVYQVVHMMEGVIERGTGRSVAVIGKPLAGKTGTANDSMDVWFLGFTPDLVAGVFVGFDDPATLGAHETGATAAAPIFRDFMKEALKNAPATPFRVPPGISLVRVNHDTGQLAAPGDRNVILEAFKTDNLNVVQATIFGRLDQTGDANAPGQPKAGGLY